MPPKGRRKGAAGTGTSTPATGSGIPGTPEPSSTPVPAAPSLAETLSYLHEPRPFKNPYYTKNHNRRSKTLKAVLNGERERVRVERERLRAVLEYEAKMKERSENVNGEEMDVDTPGEEGAYPIPTMTEAERRAVEEDTSYTSTEAAPSILPHPKYCDITGLEGPYTDPATLLRYHDKSIYDIVKGLNITAARDYLAARGAAPIVK